MQKAMTSLLFFMMVFILGCQPNIAILELTSQNVSFDEVVRMNNCGGKGETEQIVSRSFSTAIEGQASVKFGSEQIAEGQISAKYGQYKNTTKSIKLVAPPGTNMEFTLQWSDNAFVGEVTVNGEKGNYEVKVPLSVELKSTYDKGCENGSTTSEMSPTASIPTEIANQYFLFDDFNNSTKNFNSDVWICETENCNSQNTYQENGVLNLNGNKNIALKLSLISRNTVRLNKLEAFEGSIYLTKDSVGGVWVGMGEIGCGAENVLNDLGNPVIICRIKGVDALPNPISAKFETWYKVGIHYLEATKEIKFYINDKLVGSQNNQDFSSEVYAYLSIWKEVDYAAFGYFDNISVQLKP